MFMDIEKIFLILSIISSIVTEYVTNFREYQKLRSLNNNSPYIKVNDVLSIHDNNASRPPCLIVRVIELIKSKSDNEVSRGASVQVPRTALTVQRPTNKLIPLESIELHLQNIDPDRSVQAP